MPSTGPPRRDLPDITGVADAPPAPFLTHANDDKHPEQDAFHFVVGRRLIVTGTRVGVHTTGVTNSKRTGDYWSFDAWDDNHVWLGTLATTPVNKHTNDLLDERPISGVVDAAVPGMFLAAVETAKTLWPEWL